MSDQQLQSYRSPTKLSNRNPTRTNS